MTLSIHTLPLSILMSSLSRVVIKFSASPPFLMRKMGNGPGASKGVLVRSGIPSGDYS
jgi:hypothetical protein